MIAVETEVERLKAALRRIATLQPNRTSRARMRSLVVHLQSIAVSALGESIRLGIDSYDSERPDDDGPYTGERGNLDMRNFR